jgi:hypothetical protein
MRGLPCVVVPVRLSWAEWDLFDLLAGGRRISVEQQIRSELRLGALDAERLHGRAIHLAIVQPTHTRPVPDDS